MNICILDLVRQFAFFWVGMGGTFNLAAKVATEGLCSSEFYKLRSIWGEGRAPMKDDLQQLVLQSVPDPTFCSTLHSGLLNLES